MPRSVDETRREFLLKLARSAAFVPPLMASVGIREAAAQGKGSVTSNDTDGGKGAGVAAGQSTVGSLSPTAQVIDNPSFRLESASQSTSPWGASRQGAPPPWATPPPTQTGR